MSEQNIQQWCKQNNWTEPRRLANGVWVAFPPEGVIETPLPGSSQELKPKINRIEYLVNASILIVSAAIVGAIALIFSPLFLLVRISWLKKINSQSKSTKISTD